jgi:hypothetical protein
MPGDATISTQNMSFIDNSPGQMDSRGTDMDPTRNLGFMSDTTLDNFFSRPVKIFTTEWDISTPLFKRFNPWKLFWENSKNIDKIKNYYLLKCTMHIKLLINGNAFYYGRAILSYEPLASADNTAYNKQVRNNAYVIQDVVRSSQRMHIYINPTESQGGSLTLPFFNPANAIVIPDNGWDDMGDCVLQSINNLQHANGGTDSLTISVLAWAENVSFAIPTAAEPQMGIPEMADEHNEDVISRPASTIARYAGALSNVPWIGPFAKATEIGAGAIASVAKIFGYSAPTNLDYSLMTPLPRTSMAVVDTKYPTNKLSVDSKQEVTLDPATTGIASMDELPIASIAGRESYLTTFDWTIARDPEDMLFQCYVDPFMVVTNAEEHHFTACAAAVLPFAYWRGSMRFRFQIVSSAYHKGRIRIVYDPTGGSLRPDYNTHYTTIHDISNEKDFTVDVGWAQNLPYQQPLLTANPFTTNTTTLPRNVDRTNGTISVYVLNELSVPGTVVADIQVNVFVSMLDDFEVAQPNSRLAAWRFRNATNPQRNLPEMGIPEMADGDPMQDMDCCDNPVVDPPTIDTMADALIDTPDTTKLFFGEVIGSFRQMLKRTVLSEVIPIQELQETSRFLITRTAMPGLGGRLPDSENLFANSQVLTYSNGQKYLPVSTTYINYVTQMFAGWRGSIRWTVDASTLHVAGGDDRYNSVSVLVSRSPLSSRTQKTEQLRDITKPLHNIAISLLEEEQGTALNGLFVGNSNVNPLISAEVPFYSPYRFYPTWLEAGYDRLIEQPSFIIQGVIPQSRSDGDDSFLRMFVSAGEDFNLFYFNGLPPMFYQPSLPLDPGQ